MFGQSKPLTSDRAWTYAAINQFVTPGMGSIMGGRRISGVCQLLLALAGCGFLLIWVSQFYRLAFASLNGGDQPTFSGWTWKWGLACFAASWFWSLATSVSLVRHARPNEPRKPPDLPPPLPGAPDVPPRIINPPPEM